MPFCNNCGYKVDDNDKFCFECGSKVNISENDKVDREILKKYLSQQYVKQEVRDGVSIWNYYLKSLKTFYIFKGNANRKEWFSFFLINIPVSVIFCIIIALIFSSSIEFSFHFAGRLRLVQSSHLTLPCHPVYIIHFKKWMVGLTSV